jgi:hypothetical protein
MIAPWPAPAIRIDGSMLVASALPGSLAQRLTPLERTHRSRNAPRQNGPPAMTRRADCFLRDPWGLAAPVFPSRHRTAMRPASRFPG